MGREKWAKAFLDSFVRFGVPSLIFCLIFFSFAVMMWGIYLHPNSILPVLCVGLSALSLTATVSLWVVVLSRILSTHSVRMVDLRSGKIEPTPHPVAKRQLRPTPKGDPFLDPDEEEAVENNATKIADKAMSQLFGRGRENLDDQIL